MMPRPRLHSPDQPWPVRWLLWLYQFAASLPLAIVLLTVYGLVLIWATFVEGRYGTAAAAFGVYGSWWFAVLHALLGLNVLAAALIRFPWQRPQVGFLVTHLGILVLMVGCLITWWGGIRATLPIFEGHSSWQAFEDALHFDLSIEDESSDAEDEPETAVVRFRGGPFNWTEYEHLPAFPWRWSPRDRGVLYDRDGVRLEVLDYYSDSAVERLPYVSLRTSDLPAWRRAVQVVGAAPWKAVALSGAPPGENPHGDEEMPRRGNRAAGRGNERFLLWTAATAAETDAFLHALPRGPLGAKGQVVLRAGGKNYYISVDEKAGQPRFPLGDGGLEVQLDFVPDFLAVKLRLYTAGSDNDATPEPQEAVLFADMPSLNRQAVGRGVFGYFWFDAAGEFGELLSRSGGKALIQEARRPRIDLLQGHDQKLYYRTWLSPHAGSTGELAADGAPATLLREVGDPVTVCVDFFQPRGTTETAVVPLPFRNPDNEDRAPPQPRARVQLTVDGCAQDFWLAAKPMLSPPFSALPEPERSDYRETVSGDGRRVRVALARDTVDLGFRVYLHQFDKRLVPGTRQAEGYSSWIEMRARDDETRIAESGRGGEETTLNAPLTFRDPDGGRAFRLYQSSYRFVPSRPGDPGFDTLAAGTSRTHVFLSYLTANYDPGRGVKYAGCMLIVAGIAMVFYMKAFFFRGLRRGVSAALLMAVALWAAPACAAEPAKLDWTDWQHVPVFGQGRVMPLDTFARSVVRKVCGRENPRLDLDGAAFGEGDQTHAEEVRKLFPNGQPRKFTAAELLFSWLVEPERWQDVPLFAAEHEALRREVLKLPAADAEGRRLKRISPRQLEEAATFQQRRSELDDERARALREEKDFSPTGLDEQIVQLGAAADAFAVVAFRPEGDTFPQEAFLAELRGALKTFGTLSGELGRWGDLVQREPPIDRIENWQQVVALHRQMNKTAASLDAVLRDQRQEVRQRRFTVAAVLPLTVEFRKSAGELAMQLAAQRKRLQQRPEGVSNADWTMAVDRLRNLAALGDTLSRQARHLPIALYDNVWSDETSMGLQVRRLRVMPTGASAAKGDGEEDLARPWISLQAVLYAPREALAGYPLEELQEVRDSFAAAAGIYRDRDAPDRAAQFKKALHRFAESLRKLGAAVDDDAYPPPGAVDLEVRYNRFDPFLWAWVSSLAALGCFALCFGLLRKPMFWTGMAVLVLAQVIVLVGLVLRTCISGWVSVTNMFESVVFVSLAAATLGTCLTLAPLLWPGLRNAWRWTAIPGTWETGWAAGADAASRPRWTAGRGILVGLRVLLGGGVVYAASFATLGPSGKGQILALWPKVAEGASLPTVNDLIVWLVGLCLLVFVVWWLPRLILSAGLGAAAVPAAWAKDGLSGPLRETLARRSFAMAGAVVCFLAAYLAYYAPVFKKDIPSLAAALRDNFWLTFHVVPIMASYAAGALGWGLANIAVFYYLLGRYGRRTAETENADEQPADVGTVPVFVSARTGQSRSADKGTGPSSLTRTSGQSPAVRAPAACDSLGKFNYRAMQVAVLLLIAGTILGALWADVVWGRFWSWDRKEVWSLVSIVVYMVILHGRSARWFGNFGLAVGSVIGFTSIVMTWYGLNYILPGGLHTYGRGEGGIGYVIAATGLNWLLLAAAAVRYHLETRHARRGSVKPDAPARDT